MRIDVSLARTRTTFNASCSARHLGLHVPLCPCFLLPFGSGAPLCTAPQSPCLAALSAVIHCAYLHWSLTGVVVIEQGRERAFFNLPIKSQPLCELTSRLRDVAFKSVAVPF